MTFKIKNPSTVYVDGLNFGDLVKVFDTNKTGIDALIFFRHIGNFSKIKINLPNPASYTINVGNVVDIKPIEITPLNVVLPEVERMKEKPCEIKYNKKLTGTPARIFTDAGVIEIGDEFYKYPPPIRLFILLHEYSHFFYKTESFCDLWAAKKFVEAGYNASNALYSISKVLKKTPFNVERIKFLHGQITS
jgi:hypothetical protein